MNDHARLAALASLGALAMGMLAAAARRKEAPDEGEEEPRAPEGSARRTSLASLETLILERGTSGTRDYQLKINS